MRLLQRGLLVCSAFGLLGQATLSQGDDASMSTASNLEIIRSLAARIGENVGRLLARPETLSVGVTVLPRESAWYVETAILQGLSKSTVIPRTAASPDLTVEFGFSSARVEYANVRREGFFGSKIVDRKVTVALTTKATDRRSGEILLARDLHDEYRDTLHLSEIERVESSTLPITRGTVPGEGFFSNFAEPLVMLGAIGVAIYLLFTVRS